MKNQEQLPQIDENVLDGVAGGGADSIFGKAHAMQDSPAVGIAKAAAKVPFSIAGVAANFVGDVYEALGQAWHNAGDKLTGGGKDG